MPRRLSPRPADRPFRLLSPAELHARFERALAIQDGSDGGHCIHELWMRGEFAQNIERSLERLWQSTAKTVPDWLPMRYVSWLPQAYEVASRFKAGAKG